MTHEDVGGSVSWFWWGVGWLEGHGIGILGMGDHTCCIFDGAVAAMMEDPKWF